MDVYVVILCQYMLAADHGDPRKTECMDLPFTSRA